MRTSVDSLVRFTFIAVAAIFLPMANASTPEQTLTALEESSLHLEVIERYQKTVNDHVIGLGAMKKVRGIWGLKKSERVSGQISSVTWRVLDGFSASEVLAEVEAGFGITDSASAEVIQDSSIDESTEPSGTETDSVELLFRCDGRSCGHGAQWASRIFGQRLLYGRGDAQQYRAYALQDGAYRLVIYASVRSSDRQYVHVELLALANSPEEAL